MRANCKMKCGGFFVLALLGIAAGGLAVMLLWNWLTPALFSWKEISYLQAIGILILSRLLVGGFHGRCGHRRMHLAARLEQMTPEEREKFQAGMKSKWCGFGSSESAAKKD